MLPSRRHLLTTFLLLSSTLLDLCSAQGTTTTANATTTTTAATTTSNATAAATTATAAAGKPIDTGCPPDQVSFEMVTGYVYSAPADMLDSQPGTLILTDCIETCKNNASCKSINYETGLCVLFSSNVDDNGGELSLSQFPVFTSYVQKNCLKSAGLCQADWSFERVIGHELQTDIRKRGKAKSRQECMELCLAEKDFQCRSAAFKQESGDCRLYSHDRHTLAGSPSFVQQEGIDYLEINCNLDEPKRLCVYDKVMGKILKTVDSVYQAIDKREDCEDLCNNAPFRCHSYDFNDTGDNICRLSHHSAYTLTQIEEPYLAIEEAATYELSGCYNVTIDCHSGDMTANVLTTSLFNGKIYAKGSPVTCMVDVNSTLDFSITMAYNDLECGVKRESAGVYKNELIIQHHDRIVTSDDLGLSLTCQYDLANKSVSNTVDLDVTGEITPSLYEEAVVDSPNVAMRVENANGENTKEAVVGDPLNMIFQIMDQDSPYEIFVRDLVAVDGATDTELVLIDSRGCPADPTIMSELRKGVLESDPKMLQSSFDAFRFPTSQTVQFRAMVTPCLPKCEPVQCNVTDYTGQGRTVDSYGRRKRSITDVAVIRSKRTAEPEEMLVIQTLKIVDKKKKKNEGGNRFLQLEAEKEEEEEHQKSAGRKVSKVQEVEVVEAVEASNNARCVDDTSLIAGAIVFLVFQVLLLVMWTMMWRRKRTEHAKEVILPPSMESSADSLSYIYDTGISRRLN